MMRRGLRQPDTLHRFLDAVAEPDDLLELRCIGPGGAVTRRWSRAAELPGLADWLSEVNDAGANIYMSANPRRAAGTGTVARTCTPTRPCGSCSSCVTLARCLIADIDHVTVEEGRRRIDEAVVPPPTAFVNSGHGLQWWWALEEPIVDLALWVGHERGLIAALDSDPHVCDPPRVMRLPGYRNLNPPPAEAVLIEADVRRIYALSEFPEGGALRDSLGTSCHSHVTGSAHCGPEVEAAVLSCLPTGPGQRRRCLFELARRLKGLYPDADPESLLWIVEQLWHPRALAFIEHKALDDSIVDFLGSWPYIRCPVSGGAGPLEQAYRAAMSRPPPPEAAQFQARTPRHLVMLAAELQRKAGDGAFFLGQDAAAELLNVKQQTASYWLGQIRSKGVLDRVAVGHTGRASEYRFIEGGDA